MLAMAMESGDVNALYALGTLLNEAALPLSDTTAPVVNDKEPKENPLQMEEMMTLLQAAVPIQKKDETLTRMKEKQRVKEQELADRLAQQSDMMSSAQSQYEDLVAKRAELNSLQAKFSMLSKEQESKGMVNHRVPEELDDETTDATMKPAPTETFTRLNPSRGSSQITLMPPEEADADTDMDDLEENYNRLQEQEEEMSYLRQQLLVLQSVKNQLETQKKSMLEHVMAQEESDVVSNNLEIETVRLREITTDTEEEAEEFEDELQVQDVSDLPMEQLMESDKLRGIIPEELTLENLLDRLLAVSVHDKVDSSVEGNAESTEEQDALVWKSGAPFQSAEAAPLVEEITIEQDMQPMETTDRVRSSILVRFSVPKTLTNTDLHD